MFYEVHVSFGPWIGLEVYGLYSNEPEAVLR